MYVCTLAYWDQTVMCMREHVHCTYVNNIRSMGVCMHTYMYSTGTAK